MGTLWIGRLEFIKKLLLSLLLPRHRLSDCGTAVLNSFTSVDSFAWSVRNFSCEGIAM